MIAPRLHLIKRAAIVWGMDLKTYIQTAESVGSLARRLKIPAALMSQWHTGVRPVPIERAVQIEQITDGAVTRRDLRPNDWDRIWPELAATALKAQQP